VVASNRDRAHTLTGAEFRILLALVDGARHGYGIMQEVLRNTDGTVRLGPGTLYRSIKQLLASGLIVESEARPAAEVDDQRRRYYRLTDLGRREVAAEARRLERLVRVAQSKRLIGVTAT